MRLSFTELLTALSMVDLANKGWMAAHDKPYIALGEFQNVISAIEGLKQAIPHSKEMTAETQKMISKVKRQKNPMFKNGRADRTLRILSKQPERDLNKGAGKQINISANFIDLKNMGEVDSTSIMKKMKMIEEQFYTTAGNFHDVHNKQQNSKSIYKTDLDVTSSHDLRQPSNQRLISPALKKLMNSKDASVMLKDEILESQLRLKAAKHGHKLDDIVPAHKHSFYLPDKTLYFDRNSNQIKPINSVNKQSVSKSAVYNPNQSFNQSIPSVCNNSAFITEPSMIIQQQTLDNREEMRKTQNNVSDYIKKRTGIQQDNKFGTARDKSDKSEINTNNRSFFSQKPFNTCYQNNASFVNENQKRGTFYKQAFKTFDAGCKKLSPKKPQRLNELSIKYREGFMKGNEYNDEQTRNRNQKGKSVNNQKFKSSNGSRTNIQPYNSATSNPIRFVSMIDSKPVQPPYLNLVPLKNFNKKDQELSRILSKDQNSFAASTNQNTNCSVDEYGKQNGSLNWGKMLNEDLDEMHKNKIDKQYEEVIKAKREQAKRRSTILDINKGEATNTTNIISWSINNENINDNYAQYEPLNSINPNSISKIQMMLLSKLISFESLDSQNTDELKRKLYNFFFNWSKEQANDNMSNKEVFDQDSNSGRDRGEYSDDFEEKKKRLQLKLDQELIEFEERGGFAKVLKDIFNPSDVNSMELDSVFQLKTLCKTFYEKKERLSTNLIQTLDALTNERPKALNLKRTHLNLDANKGNVHDDIEWMRINAERERIKDYREVAKDSALLYYKVLKRFTEETQVYEREKSIDKNNSQDPQVKMKALNQENMLKDILSYMSGKLIIDQYFTDFMRAVIENGNKFTKQHLFMMMKELNIEHLEQQLAKYLKILLDELDISRFDYEDFIMELSTNEQLQEAYSSMKDYFFNDYQ